MLEIIMRGVRALRWAGLLLLLTGAAGGAMAQGWTAFSPDGGRYRVDMPAQPKLETVPIAWGGEKLTMTEATGNGMVSGNTLRGEQKIALGRAAGREFTIVETNGTSTAVRLYWARNRLCQLLVTGRAGIENQPDTRRFFDSFALVRSQG